MTRHARTTVTAGWEAATRLPPPGLDLNEESAILGGKFAWLDWFKFCLPTCCRGLGRSWLLISWSRMERAACRVSAHDRRNRRHRFANAGGRFGGPLQVQASADCGGRRRTGNRGTPDRNLSGVWAVMTAQALIGAMSAFFIPAIAAISLGLVGMRALQSASGKKTDLQLGRQRGRCRDDGVGRIFHFQPRGFFPGGDLAAPTILSLLLIRPTEIDYELALGATEGGIDGEPSSVLSLLKDHLLAIFLCCAVLFHFANAAMLPLLGEMLAKGKGRSSMMFMSACVVTTQFTITLIAAWSGRAAGSWGRKPLLLIGFGVLPVRGILYTLTSNIYLLVGIQVLDGIGAGIFGVVSVLVVADLTRGAGVQSYTWGYSGRRRNRRGAQ